MALSPGALVCVTGANGFIGSHLVQQLLERGYRVRATVRDPADSAKTAHLVALAEGAGAAERLELARGDLMKEGSFDAAIAGCDGVFHCAAAVTFAAGDPQRDIVDPSVQGTRNVFASVAGSGSVKRVVHTSSIMGLLHWDTPHEHVFTEADWNTTSTVVNDPYGVAKVSAEREALRLAEAVPAAQGFELVHVNPGMVWGPPLTKAHCSASPSLLRSIVSMSQPGVPRLMMSVVDVRDVARAHILAMEKPDAGGRYLVRAEDLWMPDIAARLQSFFPDVAMATRTIPKPLVLAASLVDKSLHTRQLWHMVGRPYWTDASRSVDELGMSYLPVDDTLRETVAPMIEHGWARVKRR